MRDKQIIKLFRAVELIARSSGATNRELSKHLRVDRKSVYRTLKTLEAIEFPLYEERTGREVCWKFESGYLRKLPNISLPELNLTFEEVLALHLLKGESTIYRNTVLEKQVSRAYRKIGRLLPDKVAENLDRLQALFTPVAKFSKDLSGKEEIIEILVQAMLKQRVCEVEYHAFSSRGQKRYPIHPLHFFEYEGGLYLFVLVPKHEDVCVLAVERIQDLKMTSRGFEWPEDFDPRAMLENAFSITFNDPVEAKIWLSRGEVRYALERPFFAQQRIEHLNDGSVILHLKTSGRYDVKRWVMGIGPGAVVLEPEDLRQEVMKDLRRALERHEHGRPISSEPDQQQTASNLKA